MRFPCGTLIFLFCSFLLLLSTSGSNEDEKLLPVAIHALNKGLQYMESHVTVINLDGVFGVRFVAELLNAFVESRPEIFDDLGDDLRSELKNIIEKGKRIVQTARPYLKINDPKYYKSVSGILAESSVMMWHRSRSTSDALRVPPLPCSNSEFNESYSDGCLRGLTKSGDTQTCNIEEDCIKTMTAPRKRGYMITHQVLYFQLLEAHGCVSKSRVKRIPQMLKDSLCSNIMRDAEEIADSGYQLKQQDLFFEQIALCGLWGYHDFYRPDWLREILEGQEESGCYAHYAEWECEDNLKEQKTRVKREETILTELLNAFVESRPEIFNVLGHELRSELETIVEKGKRIVEIARPYLKISWPDYYEILSGMLDESSVMMWHKSRMTSDALRVPPLPCPKSYFNESYSDGCLKELTKSGDTQSCEIGEGCIKMMTAPRKRGYMITHQVLYFQLVEGHGCVGKSLVKKIPQTLKDLLCSNVMRDAEEIAGSGYPFMHQDLFMEQIALCGLWGYKDFYRPDWLKKILEWQQESGCYSHYVEWKCGENLKEKKTRVKRDEEFLTDDCLSHKTAVAISALAANIRFLIEMIYIQHKSSQFV